METVLLATTHNLVIGYVSLEGNLVIGHMPQSQEECEEDEPEFLYWMLLPQTLIWLKYRNEDESNTIQLRLWE